MKKLILLLSLVMLFTSLDTSAAKRRQSKKWKPNREYIKRHNACVKEQNRIFNRYK